MISPFTGGTVTKKSKSVTLKFRNEEFTITRYYYQCDDTGREFSDSEVDEMAMKDVYAQYRSRHNIPSPEDLKKLREKYCLSAHIMSKIAGIGINQYSHYENGEMPTIVVGNRLSMLFDHSTLLDSIDGAKHKLGKDYMKVRDKVSSFIEPASYYPINQSYDWFKNVVTSSAPSYYTLHRPRWKSIVAYCHD